MDLAAAFHAMHLQSRYAALLFVVDTCQAESLAWHFDAPNVLSLAASRAGQNSYSAAVDGGLGLALIDRFTATLLDFFEQRARDDRHWRAHASLAQLLQSLSPAALLSDPVARTDLFPYPASAVPLGLFFAEEHPTLTVRSAYAPAPGKRSAALVSPGRAAQPQRMARAALLPASLQALRVAFPMEREATPKTSPPWGAAFAPLLPIALWLGALCAEEALRATHRRWYR